MSVWQRIAASQRDNTVTTGLGRSAFAAAVTWGTLALLACFVFTIVTPEQGVNPLVSLVRTIGADSGWLAPIVLFITVIGLYGAMLATSSTLLLAVSHTLYADVFRRSGKGLLKNELESKTELNISRTILLIAAIISTILVQLLTTVGFSIADLVFAIYGAQLGLCPIAIAALVWDRQRLKSLTGWAAAAVSAGFITGWAAAVFGRLTGDTDLVFLAPVFSLVASLSMLGLGISSYKIRTIIACSANWILIKSVIKARRCGLYRFAIPDKPTRLVCLKNKCAKCCKVIGTPVVTSEEALRIGLASLMTDRGAIFIKSDGCMCTLLKAGLCSIYPHRPKGCREYPWYNINGRLHYDSGCPGIEYDKDERPDVKDIQPFDNFFPNTPKFIVWLIKKICVRR
jgi:Fe-S-cluster containining protein